MRSADAARGALAIAGLIAAFIAGNSHAAEPRYGKVETFEPGKKYTCVPTADRKGWDCKEGGMGAAAQAGETKAAIPPPPAPPPAAPSREPLPAAADTPMERPVSPVETTPRNDPARAQVVSPSPAAPAPSAPAAAPPMGAALPSYLRANNRGSAPPPQRAAAPAPEVAASAARAPTPPPSAHVTQPTPEPAPPAAAVAAPADTAPASAPITAPVSSSKPADRVPPPMATASTPASAPASAKSTPAKVEPADVAPIAESAPAKAKTSSAPVATTPEPAPASGKAPGESTRPTASIPAPPAAPPPSAEIPPAAPAPPAEKSTPPPVAQSHQPPTRSPVGAGGGNREFLSLSGSSFVIELAHSANPSELNTLRDTLHPSHGELYTLHLLRDGADWWLLLWGSFDSVESARAARGELPADTAINAGWPRRIAPLQAEAQRAGG